jgi:hypothetical protein
MDIVDHAMDACQAVYRQLCRVSLVPRTYLTLQRNPAIRHGRRNLCVGYHCVPLQRVPDRMGDFGVITPQTASRTNFDVIDDVEDSGDSVRSFLCGPALWVTGYDARERHHAIVDMYIDPRLLDARIPQ